MKEIIYITGSYIKLKLRTLIIILISIGIFLMVLSLYSLPLEAVFYATILTSAFLLIVGILNFISFYRNYDLIRSFKNNIETNDFNFPHSKDLIIKEYEELIRKITKDRLDIVNDKDKALSDMIDYYTIWAHQIKTPIAAMRLLLQSERSSLSNELQEQLFRIEQYVEMVLGYLRTESMSSDLHIRT